MMEFRISDFPPHQPLVIQTIGKSEIRNLKSEIYG